MNHLVRVFLAVGLSLAAMLIILLSTDSSGSHVQMDTLITESVHSFLGRGVAVEQYVEASLPQNFRRELSRASSGGFSSYPMTQQSTQRQFISMPGSTISYTIQDYIDSIKPLAYPPEDLWCVQLRSADPTIPKVVLFALHQDMYTAQWRVHKLYDVDAVPTAVGCQFSNQ